VTVENPDAGVDQTLTASGGAGDETINASKNFSCVNGEFGATTVKIGTTTLKETVGGTIDSDGGLKGTTVESTGTVIVGGAAALTRDPATGYVYNANGGLSSPQGDIRISGAGNNFLQQGAADGGSGEGLSYLDAGGDERMALIFPGSDIVALGNQVENGMVKIQANTAVAGAGGVTDVVTFEDTVVKFKAVEVDFANGTTYKVESDGDAIFKNIAATDYIQVNTTVDSPLSLNVTDNGWNYISFRHTAVRKAYIGIDATPDLQIIAEAGDIRFTATGMYYFGGQDVNFAGGSTYKIDSAGDAVLKSLVIASGGDLTINAGNIIMSGTGGDDERLQVPYLTGVPASVANGSVWMEADGLHIYYNGAEKLVAGV
jgi:hypothetical protein